MKNFKLLLIVLIFCSNISTGHAEETIKLASGEWAPYQSEKLKYFGVASRIVTEAFKISGIQVKYGYFPWNRSLNLAKKGKWDGTFLWFDTPERRKYFYISEPVVDIQYVFFHLKKFSFNWENVNDLKGINIGGTVGYNYEKKFQDAEKSKLITVNRIDSDEQNFKKLLAGRIQIFPNDLDAGLELIHKHFKPEDQKKITYHVKPTRAAPHHLLLSKKKKKNDKMIEFFNKGLKDLKESGKIDIYLSESRQGKYR
ncbi:MAG: amino acid ABC transporter substrate-binding protein [Desulfobacteraceae bacterium]|nr:amino acid ABC transporter substrate-binding protein [Desulfobacteraceae bacterium]